ncbi:hypothetical protein DU34_02340 [Methanosarcina mazei]|uniref:Uncharacterized protein n=1 Tax=Methanosarcina mazei TaxID=2209 RepID=A0A0F8ERE9_METMZ|nr:hypothetical protein DU34_02340 [Methanosarcina mazei]
MIVSPVCEFSYASFIVLYPFVPVGSTLISAAKQGTTASKLNNVMTINVMNIILLILNSLYFINFIPPLE